MPRLTGIFLLFARSPCVSAFDLLRAIVYNAPMQDGEQRIDELCRRRCAFALYRTRSMTSPSFVMAQDGRSEAAGEGFLICDFDGHRRVIPAERDTPPAADAFPLLAEEELPDTATTREEYGANFRRCQEALQSGQLRKIVLARTADIPCTALSPWGAFCAACDSPAAGLFTALVHTPEFGTWLFSTPELLLCGAGDAWESMALAGTRLPAGEAAWDDKNIAEHEVVADHIRRCWQGVGAVPTEAAQRRTVRAGAIEHLCTPFRVRMDAARVPALLSLLPPTPAVCGYPVQAAREFLRRHADVNRSLYAGYMGPYSAKAASLYVSLRGMRLTPRVCRLYAGGGIMPDSEEEAEWQETESKLQAMRRIVSLF